MSQEYEQYLWDQLAADPKAFEISKSSTVNCGSGPVEEEKPGLLQTILGLAARVIHRNDELEDDPKARANELYALYGDGVKKVKRPPGLDLRRESHVFTDNNDLIPVTKGTKKPNSIKNRTFRRGAEHGHPVSELGDREDHRSHLLQENQANPQSKTNISKFRRLVSSTNKERGKRTNLSHLSE